MHVESVQLNALEREVLLVDAASLESAASELVVPSAHFALVVAADTTHFRSPELVQIAERFVTLGASYVCCWGPDCDRLHHCFDEADLEVNGESSDERVLMTTSHGSESWEDALWFGVHLSFPSPFYEAGTGTLVVLSVANAEWVARARSYLASGAPVLDET